MKSIFTYFSRSLSLLRGPLALGSLLIWLTPICFSANSDITFNLIEHANEHRATKYNENMENDRNPLDLFDLVKLKEESNKIVNLLITNINAVDSSITPSQLKKTIQAVFATEIIYGPVGFSYLDGKKEEDRLYWHFYVLEYSTLYARYLNQIFATKTKSFDIDFSFLYEFTGLTQKQLFNWYCETEDQLSCGYEKRRDYFRMINPKTMLYFNRAVDVVNPENVKLKNLKIKNGDIKNNVELTEVKLKKRPYVKRKVTISG